MYLIIDKDYKVYRAVFITGRLRSLCRNGKISIINTKTMKGMNLPEYALATGEEWSPVNNVSVYFDESTKDDLICKNKSCSKNDHMNNKCNDLNYSKECGAHLI